MSRRTALSSAPRWLLAGVFTIATAGCTSSSESRPSLTDPAAPSTNYEIGRVGARASDLLTQLSDIYTCSDQLGPTDELQSPAQVGHIACGADSSDLHIFAYDDPGGIHFQVESFDIGSGVSRNYLIGPDFLIIGEPSLLLEAMKTVGGRIYSDRASALVENPGYSEGDRPVSCHLFLTSVVVDYGVTGEDHLDDLDQTSIPGVEKAYEEQMNGVVPSLNSFKSGNDSAIRKELLPYANTLRSICRKLFPT